MSRTIDYILADGTTSRRLSSSLVRKRMPYPNDHEVLGLSLDLSLHLHLPPRRRATTTAISWLPTNPEQYDKLIRDSLVANLTTIANISETLLAAAQACPASTAQRRLRPGRSPREDEMRARLRCALLSQDERAALVQSMWDARYIIMSEKTVSRTAGILGNLREGDWGARHLSQSYAPMQFLKQHGSRIVDPCAIALEAHVYYSDLLASPAEEFRAQNVALSEELKVDRAMELISDATLNIEVIPKLGDQ